MVDCDDVVSYLCFFLNLVWVGCVLVGEVEECGCGEGGDYIIDKWFDDWDL